MASDIIESLRKRVADERGLPPYIIFHDSTLRQMAAELPLSRAALARINGVGERKLLDFGDVFLAEIREYVEHVGATGAEPPPLVSRR